MNRITLRHLTFVGQSVAAASVDFGPKLTIVYGASETGKSYIVEALDFMLGTSELRAIPEAQGYSRILLGLTISDNETVTLTRSLDGGDFELYYGDVRALPSRPPDETLSEKSGSKTPKSNLSKYILAQVSLQDALVRTNSANKKRPLSIRDLAHLIVVNETQMQARQSPVLPTGQYTRRTLEASVFRMLLQGEDDSQLIETADSTTKKVNRGKIELLAQVITDLERQLQTGDDESALRDRLQRVDNAIEEHVSSIEGAVRNRAEVVARLQALSRSSTELHERISDGNSLAGRFGLLLEQYESDLTRLALVQEAGSLLGFFDPGVCVFCGALPENQHLREHLEIESTALAESVSSEIDKTMSLRDDLRLTVEDLNAQIGFQISQTHRIDNEISTVNDELRRIDSLLDPERSALGDLMAMKSSIEKSLSVIEQIAVMNERIAAMRSEDEHDSQPVDRDPSDLMLEGFTGIVREMLNIWEVPESSTVHYDKKRFDLVVGGRLRSARGKGMRAVLHAAFTLSLARHCLDRGLPHPGFTVLDSPVVTYRGPESGDHLSSDDELMPQSVADRLFSYAATSFPGQCLIIENVDPPTTLNRDTRMVKFTRLRTEGRYGFFPPLPEDGG
ncbi:ATP-binding protein [Frankia sp. Cj3]|uniref:ATP-binding protein n=1 Tax=Frankia sp. Cj3 TaxID=2880976 RepID=UPI001EF66739|nr:ATP-binding protein [Frankia sp. Cj3]